MLVSGVKVKWKWLMGRFISALWNSLQPPTITKEWISIFSLFCISIRMAMTNQKFWPQWWVQEFLLILEDQHEITNKRNSIPLLNPSYTKISKNNISSVKIKAKHKAKLLSRMILKVFTTTWQLLTLDTRSSIRSFWPLSSQIVFKYYTILKCWKIWT